jgi:hypothetical protein
MLCSCDSGPENVQASPGWVDPLAFQLQQRRIKELEAENARLKRALDMLVASARERNAQDKAAGSTSAERAAKMARDMDTESRLRRLELEAEIRTLPPR